MTRAALALLVCSAALAADKLPPGAVSKADTSSRRCLAVVSPDGGTVAVRVPEGIDLIDLKTGKAVTLRDDPGGKRFLPEKENRDYMGATFAFFPDGKAVVTTNRQPCVSVWDAATGKRLRDVPMPNAGKHDNEGKPTDEREPADGVYCSPHFNGVLVQGVRLHRLGDKDAWTQVAFGCSGVCTHATSNGRWLSAVDVQASVECWFFSLEPKVPEPLKGDRSEEFSGRVAYDRYAHLAATSEDGKLVAAWSTASNGKAELSGVSLISRAAKKDEVSDTLKDAGGKDLDKCLALGFSGDSARVLCVTDEKVAVWDAATGKRGKDVKLPVKPVAVAIDPPRDRAVVLGDGHLCVVELK